MKRLISLLAAVTAVVMFALPSFAQTSYTWQLDCKNAGGAGGSASWTWLNNGLVISFTDPSNGSASCPTPLMGIGVIPTSINGITVNGIMVSLAAISGFCTAGKMVTKSFDPSDPDISISETLSVGGTVQVFGFKEKCPSASFSFSLGTP